MAQKRNILVYLANLSHVRSGILATESIPLNIGYLATFLKDTLPFKVDCQLFCEPEKLEKAFEKETPHILAVSNYIWNSNLNYLYASYYKQAYPEMMTLMGGPNFPGKAELKQQWLKAHPDIDFYALKEGEQTLAFLVDRFVTNGFGTDEIQESNIPGCCFMNHEELIDGGNGKRIEDFASLSSPYLTGMLDEFIEQGLVPVLQSNRGCPFKCAYCHSGDDYGRHIRPVPWQTVCDEIEYIAKKTTASSVHIADDNFGILEQDITIADKLIACRRRYGWPKMVLVSTSKTAPERVGKCLKRLGKSVYISASVQSMNENTLAEIKRKNLSFETYLSIINDLKRDDVHSLCELIIPMPKETVSSHLSALEKALRGGIDWIDQYTCMLLPNTDLAEDEYFDRFDMKRKCRIIPRDFGLYLDNRPVFEVEEVCVGTNSMSFLEYVDMRGFFFVVGCCYNLGAFQYYVRYFKKAEISLFDWLLAMQNLLKNDGSFAGDIYSDFMRETKDELFPSKEAIYSYFNMEKGFDELLGDRRGANLIMKYQAKSMLNLKAFIKVANHAALKLAVNCEPIVFEEIGDFELGLNGDLFGSETPIEMEFSIDLPAWNDSKSVSHSDFDSGPVSITFYHTDEQRKLIVNQQNQYGSSDDARGKILTRISPHQLQRNWRYSHDL